MVFSRQWKRRLLGSNEVFSLEICRYAWLKKRQIMVIAALPPILATASAVGNHATKASDLSGFTVNEVEKKFEQLRHFSLETTSKHERSVIGFGKIREGVLNPEKPALPKSVSPVHASQVPRPFQPGQIADVSTYTSLEGQSPYFEGQQVQFNIVVSNQSHVTATDVRLLATTTNLMNLTARGCTGFPNCSLGNLEGGKSIRITLSATILRASSFGISISATAGNGRNIRDSKAGAVAQQSPRTPTPTPIEITPTPTPTARPPRKNSADLSLAKELVTNGPFKAGQPISYTIIVTNNGPATATSLTITDIPANLTITEVSGDCTGFPCKRRRLDKGKTVTIKVTALIKSDGAFDNSASVRSNNDPDFRNDRDDKDNGGTTDPPDPPLSWTLILLGVGGLMAGGTVLITASRLLRRRKWRRRINVTSSVDLVGPSAVGPLRAAAPSIGVSAHLEPGCISVGPILDVRGEDLS